MQVSLSKRCIAEFFGTFWLVFGGCGAALFAAAFPSLGIGFLGVAFAFGLTLLTMAYAIGHISGCHHQPRGHARPGGGQALSGQGDPALLGRTGVRRIGRVGRAVRHLHRP